jgi:hypothetical protein
LLKCELDFNLLALVSKANQSECVYGVVCNLFWSTLLEYLRTRDKLDACI